MKTYETLKVVDGKGNETRFEVIKNNQLNNYSVITPNGNGKTYKSLKMVNKYLATFNLMLA